MGVGKFSLSKAIGGGFRAQWRNGFMLNWSLKLKQTKKKKNQKEKEENMGPIQPRIGRLTQRTRLDFGL